MTVCSDLADYEWLTGSDARALLEELAAEKSPLHLVVSRLRRRVTQNQTHLLIEQTELRRRAAAKFTRADQMFFTATGLEQATDEWVARYKASRFAAQRVGGRAGDIADLCCGIGGDLVAFAKTFRAVGVERDPIAAHFAAVNVGAEVRAVDATDFNLDGFAAFHIDPDRRPTDRRTTSLEYCQPNREAIEQLLRHLPDAAVKLAPATVVPREWAERCELEWISRDGECRQLVAWHGSLAQRPGRRCATILSATRGYAPRTVVGIPRQVLPIAEKPNRYVFDVDPAVLAAKLKGSLAAEHQLSALGDGPTYLTGPHALDDAALACFEVDDVAPLHPTMLAKYLSARGIGRLEIKKRGIDIDPEELRRQLKLRGDNGATLLVTQVAGRARAILAHRIAK
ncbi:MAG TPA: class I SAM-dependent methyltransferase [Lacipirellulaceae bacterium]|nr:class I SAM-dependent methyltransferase [Lacipirellulaceae bacterium]